ncbi:MAG: hypothetical protein IJG00_05350 [Clostridia bacterium]|nr:hypothetical protein [Clostridia bacterium]MBQ3641883.1 hypothetical protein [bacterium]
MDELQELIKNMVSTAIKKAVEDNQRPKYIIGVKAIAEKLGVSRNTFLANYQHGLYGKAVRKVSKQYYFNPSLLFE